MDKNLEKSLDAFWLNGQRHCRRFRLHDPLAGLPLQVRRKVAMATLDFFEREAQRCFPNGHEGAGTATPNGEAPGEVAVQRLRGATTASR